MVRRRHHEVFVREASMQLIKLAGQAPSGRLVAASQSNPPPVTPLSQHRVHQGHPFSAHPPVRAVRHSGLSATYPDLRQPFAAGSKV
jgi:hypothetical protein